MSEKLELRYTFIILTLIAISCCIALAAQRVFEDYSSQKYVQVYKGDVVKFKWTADNVFYSKICTDYGTAVDQYGRSSSPAYKVVILCKHQHKVEFIPLMIQACDVIGAERETIQSLNPDLLE